MHTPVQNGQVGHVFLLLELGRIAFQNLSLGQVVGLERGKKGGETQLDYIKKYIVLNQSYLIRSFLFSSAPQLRFQSVVKTQ